MRPGFSNPVAVRAGRRLVVAALTARRLDRSACATAGWEPGGHRLPEATPAHRNDVPSPPAVWPNGVGTSHLPPKRGSPAHQGWTLAVAGSRGAATADGGAVRHAARSNTIVAITATIRTAK